MKNNIIKLVVLMMILIGLLYILPITFSRFESNILGSASVEAALYILNADYQTNTIALPSIVPRDEPYTYTFSVANNKDGKRLETKLKYNLMIRTTTNLPITYELYKNITNLNEATSIKISDEVKKDADGTYFRYIVTNEDYFSYVDDEVNYYTLVVYFPSEYSSFKYQDVVEFIEINIDSMQMIEGEWFNI